MRAFSTRLRKSIAVTAAIIWLCRFVSLSLCTFSYRESLSTLRWSIAELIGNKVVWERLYTYHSNECCLLNCQNLDHFELVHVKVELNQSSTREQETAPDFFAAAAPIDKEPRRAVYSGGPCSGKG